MARNSTAATITELITELEAVNDIVRYVEICEQEERQQVQRYTGYLEESPDNEYYKQEIDRHNTRANTFASYKRVLINYAIV